MTARLAAELRGLASVLAPLVCGLLLALGARRALGREVGSRARALLAASAALVVGAALLAGLPALGVWDALTVAVAAGLGVWLGAGPHAGRGLTRVCVVSALVCLVLEVAARQAPRSARRLPGGEAARWLVPFADRDAPCRGMFPAEAYWSERDPPAAAARGALPRVVHVGDSMVEPAFVDGADGFVARLDRGDARARHLDGGIQYASPEAYWLFARQWLAHGRVDHLVVYLFAGNDFVELDRGYLCCDGGPIVAWEGEQPRVACTAERVGGRAVERLATSPAPYLARTWSSDSALAERVSTDLYAWVYPLLMPEAWDRLSDGVDERSARGGRLLGAMFAEVAARGVPATVVVLPYRPAIARAAGVADATFDVFAGLDRSAAEAHGAMVRAARATGHPVEDAWDVVLEAVRREGLDAIFLPGDVHFSPRGHEVMAEWLGARMGARWRGP